MAIRLIVTALLLAVAAPLGGEAQSAGKVYRIGILTGDSAFHREGVVVFKQALADLGYRQGQHLVFDERFVPSPTQLRGTAVELLHGGLDVLVAFTTQPAVAAKAATNTTPIVFAIVSDPVDAGLVARLGSPNSNATGLALMQPELSAKQLQLLKELLPGLSRLAVLWNAAHPGKQLEFKHMEIAAQALRVRISSVEVRTPDDFTEAFATLSRIPVEALVVLGEPLVASRAKDLLSLASKQRLPFMADTCVVPEGGGLISYGPDLNAQFRGAAIYVDKILKGAKPSDLPVEQPTKFELVINLKTATVLGLKIPQSLLLRADEVIQ